MNVEGLDFQHRTMNLIRRSKKMKGNGLGPENKGPKTGRGLGFCYGWGKSGYMNYSGIGTRFRPEESFSHDYRKQYHKEDELSD